MTVTLRFQSTGMVPGSGEPVTLRGPSLTIGRGKENDLVLPDPDRMISKHHCVIEDHNGNIVVVDLSTNGTFLNYGKVPLGQNPTPLNDGDILSLGGYELIVAIRDDQAAGDGIAAPAEERPVSHGQSARAPEGRDLLDDSGPEGDFLDDLLGSSEGPKGPRQIKTEDPMDELLPPLDEEEDPLTGPAPSDVQEGMGGSAPEHSPATQDHFAPSRPSAQIIPDDWDDDLLAGGGAGEPPSQGDPFAEPAPPPAEAPVPEPPMPEQPAVEPSVPEPPQAPAAPPQQPAHAQQPAPAGDQAAARAFLAAAGADGVNVPDEELTETMARLGAVLNTMITGLREILMTRTSIKSEFRIDQTMIRAQGNNPLKFSISPEQAVEAMVRPNTKGYLEASDAAEQALEDIKAHEIATITGMEAALKGVLARLDPAALEKEIERGGGLGSLLKGKKARYWEVYEKMYSRISDQAENEFHELFSKEFARAYKEQLDKLK